MKSENRLKHVALIPARGGSTGVKNKNLRKISGKSLVRIAWEQIIEAGFFDLIILSTDKKEIAHEISTGIDFDYLNDNSYSKFEKNGILHKRDSAQSGTYSLISNLAFNISRDFSMENLWIIQPTSPFRSNQDFESLKKLAEDELDWTSLISVKLADTIHPFKMFYEREHLAPVVLNNLDDSQPRQLLPKVVIKDGGFYILKGKNLENEIFLGDKIRSYRRGTDFNVNIDTPEDLKIARFLYRGFRNKF